MNKLYEILQRRSLPKILLTLNLALVASLLFCTYVIEVTPFMWYSNTWVTLLSFVTTIYLLLMRWYTLLPHVRQDGVIESSNLPVSLKVNVVCSVLSLLFWGLYQYWLLYLLFPAMYHTGHTDIDLFLMRFNLPYWAQDLRCDLNGFIPVVLGLLIFVGFIVKVIILAIRKPYPNEKIRLYAIFMDLVMLHTGYTILRFLCKVFYEVDW